MADRDHLLHEAYRLTFTGLGEAELEERLSGLFPGAARYRLCVTLEMAWTLRDVAVSVRLKKAFGILDDEDALEELKRRCPGFSDRTYLAALDLVAEKDEQ
ncbi:MAG TPA: hypothetical protein PLS81_12970 [Deltaproteobacteria bacterium]|nr:hypothetical protein [Deltaproteobacteria bacterium]